MISPGHDIDGSRSGGVMGRVVQSKLLACCLAVFVAYSTIPGCAIRFGPIPEGETAGDGTDPSTTPQDPVDPQPTPEEETEAAFAQVDPQEFALAQAKSLLT